MSNAEAGSSDLSGRRVLVVEDEFLIADDVSKALRILGAEVISPVATRDEALAVLCGGKKIDLAVLDINLQDQLVYPVADALAERGIPFLFATGYDSAVVPKGHQHVPRWEKPFDHNRLAQALSRLLKRAP